MTAPWTPGLDLTLVDLIAQRVLQLLGDRDGDEVQLLTVAQVARRFQVHPSWVYANARRLGALRLGTGPKAPLRFDPRRVALAVEDPPLSGGRPVEDTPAPEAARPRRGRPPVASVACYRSRMPERSRSRRGKPEAETPDARAGEVKKIWRKRDQQWRFALRIWWQGERVWVPLGLEADGWNDYRAKLELENVMREIAAGSLAPAGAAA